MRLMLIGLSPMCLFCVSNIKYNNHLRQISKKYTNRTNVDCETTAAEPSNSYT